MSNTNNYSPLSHKSCNSSSSSQPHKLPFTATIRGTISFLRRLLLNTLSVWSSRNERDQLPHHKTMCPITVYLCTSALTEQLRSQRFRNRRVIPILRNAFLHITSNFYCHFQKVLTFLSSLATFMLWACFSR